MIQPCFMFVFETVMFLELRPVGKREQGEGLVSFLCNAMHLNLEPNVEDVCGLFCMDGLNSLSHKSRKNACRKYHLIYIRLPCAW